MKDIEEAIQEQILQDRFNRQFEMMEKIKKQNEQWRRKQHHPKRASKAKMSKQSRKRNR